MILAVVVGASTYWKHRSFTAAEKLYRTSLLAEGSDEQVKSLDDVARSYARTSAGQQAMLKLSDIYLGKKEYDKAEEILKTLAGRSRNHSIVMVAALHKLGEVQFAKGDFAQSAETYLKAASDPHNLVAGLSRLNAARSLEHAGDNEKAAALYRQIASEAGENDRAIKDASEGRLLWLITNNRISG